MPEKVQVEPEEEAFRELEELVAARKYRSFTLRVEILKPNRFVTACMSFAHDQVNKSEQQLFDYPHALLASFTCDVDMWLDFALRVINGELEIAGIQIPAHLSYSNTSEELYLGQRSNQPRKTFWFSQTSTEQLYSNKPLVAPGLPPFANLADAAARYVHEIKVAHNQTPHERTLVIALPQPSSLGLVEWLPGELRVRLLHDLAGHQLDIFYWQPNRVVAAQSLRTLSREHSVPVPSGTTTIAGHLLGPDGVITQSFVLDSPYSFIGEATSALSIEQQIRADIRAGESENREMKAFFNPDENTVMRDRVLHSCIAFANTIGGSLYVGVEDGGDLSGNGKLSRTMKKARTPAEGARALSATLRKYIVENTRPVIEVEAAELKIGSEWIVRFKIEPSPQMITTHTNDVFIRAGASNRKPSADWLEARTAKHRPRLPNVELWN
jgi:hypothetical protein